MSMTEKEKMLAGEIYSAVDPQLIEELTEVKDIIHDYNLLRPSEKQKAREILKGMLGHIADDEILIIQPFYCDYGKQISVGKRFFANFNFTVLDEAPVTIGDDCFIGPNVSISISHCQKSLACASVLERNMKSIARMSPDTFPVLHLGSVQTAINNL